jgi:hypothetical protein
MCLTAQDRHRQGHPDRYAELDSCLVKDDLWKNPEMSAVPIVAGSAACISVA